MDNEYYILEDGNRIGPFAAQDLMMRPLEPGDIILSPFQNQGVPAYTIPQFKNYFTLEGIYHPTVGNAAGFPIRFVAYMIDLVLMVVVFAFLLPLFFPQYVLEMQKYTDYKSINEHALPLQIGIIVFRTIYFSVCESNKLRGSVGKYFCGLAVVDELGYTITFSQALKRNTIRIVSDIFFGFGYVSILFTKQHQALHDQFSGCYVIKKNS